MTTGYTIENYGPGGELLSTSSVTLTGEEEQAYLALVRVPAAYQTLRQWSLDAQSAYDDWPNKTAAQKDAVQRETIRRLGVFMDRLADLLLLEGRT